MAAVEATDTYIASLGADLPDPPRDDLNRCVVHLQSPLLDPTAMAEHVEACRYAQSAKINRGGLLVPWSSFTGCTESQTIVTRKVALKYLAAVQGVA
jgi:hypothetical protein